MGTTDPNGIYMYEDTDPLVPFASLLNTGQASVSAKFSNIDPGLIHYVANVAERSALASTFNPTSSKPLFVYRADAANGFELEYTENGTAWRAVTGGFAGNYPGHMFIPVEDAQTTNMNGDLGFTIPGGGFPNALIGCSITDANANMALGPITFRWNKAASSKTVFNYRVIGSSGALGNFPTRASILLWGN